MEGKGKRFGLQMKLVVIRSVEDPLLTFLKQQEISFVVYCSSFSVTSCFSIILNLDFSSFCTLSEYINVLLHNICFLYSGFLVFSIFSLGH
jgi:hypothetical protein